jgi:hypothetical protein
MWFWPTPWKYTPPPPKQTKQKLSRCVLECAALCLVVLRTVSLRYFVSTASQSDVSPAPPLPAYSPPKVLLSPTPFSISRSGLPHHGCHYRQLSEAERAQLEEIRAGLQEREEMALQAQSYEAEVAARLRVLSYRCDTYVIFLFSLASGVTTVVLSSTSTTQLHTYLSLSLSLFLSLYSVSLLCSHLCSSPGWRKAPRSSQAHQQSTPRRLQLTTLHQSLSSPPNSMFLHMSLSVCSTLRVYVVIVLCFVAAVQCSLDSADPTSPLSNSDASTVSWGEVAEEEDSLLADSVRHPTESHKSDLLVLSLSISSLPSVSSSDSVSYPGYVYAGSSHEGVLPVHRTSAATSSDPPSSPHIHFSLFRPSFLCPTQCDPCLCFYSVIATTRGDRKAAVSSLVPSFSTRTCTCVLCQCLKCAGRRNGCGARSAGSTSTPASYSCTCSMCTLPTPRTSPSCRTRRRGRRHVLSGTQWRRRRHHRHPRARRTVLVL